MGISSKIMQNVQSKGQEKYFFTMIASPTLLLYFSLPSLNLTQGSERPLSSMGMRSRPSTSTTVTTFVHICILSLRANDSFSVRRSVRLKCCNIQMWNSRMEHNRKLFQKNTNLYNHNLVYILHWQILRGHICINS